MTGIHPHLCLGFAIISKGFSVLSSRPTGLFIKASVDVENFSALEMIGKWVSERCPGIMPDLKPVGVLAQAAREQERLKVKKGSWCPVHLKVKKT